MFEKEFENLLKTVIYDTHSLKETEEIEKELLSMHKSFLLMQSIEKDFILAGLFMVLAKTRKELYKEDNSSNKVKTIHNSINIVNNLISKLED